VVVKTSLGLTMLGFSSTSKKYPLCYIQLWHTGDFGQGIDLNILFTKDMNHFYFLELLHLSLDLLQILCHYRFLGPEVVVQLPNR